MPSFLSKKVSESLYYKYSLVTLYRISHLRFFIPNSLQLLSEPPCEKSTHEGWIINPKNIILSDYTNILFPMGRIFTLLKNQLNQLIFLGLLMSSIAASAQVTVSVVGTNATCFGLNNGYATAIASGGWAPYTYQWSNGGSTATIAALPPGTYTVTVTDIDLGFGTASVTITEPPQIGVTVYSQSQICSVSPDGTATAVPYGGTPPYTYHWSNGGTSAMITGLAAGTYTVTVTDATNCTTVGSVNVLIFGNEGIWIGDSTVNVTCFGANNGMAIAMPMSGTPPYTYQWSNGGTTMKVNNLAPGTYTVTVTDANGCFGTWPFIISQPTDLTLIGGTTPAACSNNGTATITPNGGTAPYNIIWSPGGYTNFTVTSLAPGAYSVTVTDANGCTEGATVTVTGNNTALVVNGTVQAPAGCTIGGSATVSVTSGSGSYKYLWDNGQMTAVATGLTVGNHTVTVMDLVTNCMGVGTVNIPQATPIITTVIVTTNATCSLGGTATASATGGVPPYTYAWSNGQTGPNATNLMAGTVIVTVTDATGCVATQSGTVTQTQGPSVTAVVNTNATCTTGGTATATATGGATPYTYLWSNGATTATATGLLAGTRTVTVTDANGCAASASVTITQPNAPTVTAAAGAAATCITGGSATATGSGGVTPYTYKWSNNATTATITNLVAGTYTVTITDVNGCTATASVSIAAPLTPTVIIASSTNANCNQPGSATAMAAGGVAPYTYAWSNGETGITAVNLPGGTYTVTVTAANGCTATATVTIGSTNNGISIGDYVWYDNDQDGFQHPLETNGVPGMTVMLITPGNDGFFGTSDDVTLQTTTTNAAGLYQFNCVTPGTYILMFNGIPSGYEFTSKDAVNNDCKDSDVNANGKTSPFTIVSGQGNNFCLDAGIHIICVNILYPGTICCDQVICEGDVPALLTESTPPSGGSGALEYLWMEYIQVGPSNPAWYPIPGATSSSYQPGPLTKTSFFMRCVRRAGCNTFLETNIVTITVNPAGSPGCGNFIQQLVLRPSGTTNVELEWTTYPEPELYIYTVQHSVNSVDWDNVTTVMGHHDSNNNNVYSFIDQTPVSGVNFYRIKRTNFGNVASFSETKNIELSLSGANAIAIYPNPVQNSLIIKNIAKYDADVEITNTATNGDVIKTIIIKKDTLEMTDLDMDNVPSGMYFARIRFANGETSVVKISKI